LPICAVSRRGNVVRSTTSRSIGTLPDGNRLLPSGIDPAPRLVHAAAAASREQARDRAARHYDDAGKIVFCVCTEAIGRGIAL